MNRIKLGSQTYSVPSGKPAQLLNRLADEIPQAQAELNSLIEYLCSSKFWQDPYVNVSDILPRLQQVRLNLTAIAGPEPRIEYLEEATRDVRS